MQQIFTRRHIDGKLLDAQGKNNIFDTYYEEKNSSIIRKKYEKQIVTYT